MHTDKSVYMMPIWREREREREREERELITSQET